MPQRPHQPLTADILRKIEGHFHAVIRERAGRLIEEHGVQLPRLDRLVDVKNPVWFPVPGMSGGFSYWFEGESEQLKLVAESWCRVVEGSGQRHEITAAGSRLVAEGFV